MKTESTTYNLLNSISYPENLTQIERGTNFRRYVQEELRQDTHSRTFLQSGTLCCEFGYGGTDRCAALRLQHSIRPHCMGCGASGLRAHDAHWTSREAFCTNRKFKGIRPFPTPVESDYDTFACGQCLQFYFGGFGYGRGGSQKRRERPPCGSRYRRRQHERRTGFRRVEQRLIHQQQPADYPQR